MTMIVLNSCCGNKNNNFNLLRLLGASLVIFGHSYAIFGPQGVSDFIQAHTHVLSAGYLGVQIFFVISGFLVAQSFVARPRCIEFFTARVLRIFPGLVVAVFFAIVLGCVFSKLPFKEYIDHPKVWSYFVQNSTLKLQWELPGVFENNSFKYVVNGSLWTLPVEFKLYVILMVVGLVGVLNSRVVTNVVAAALIYLHLQKSATYFLSGGDVNVDSVIFCFLIGVLFYANRDKILISARLAAIVLVLTLLSVHYNYFTFVFLHVCIAYWVFVVAFHEKLQVRFVRNADYSYGLYIYAFPIQQAVAQCKIFHNFHFYVISCFLLILPVAMLSWHFVEKPSLRLKKWIQNFIDSNSFMKSQKCV
jgi:peptidoglycan/LPS O-acetylase OafA/YrhL